MGSPVTAKGTGYSEKPPELCEPDDLLKFANWFLSQPIGFMTIPRGGGVRNYGVVTSLVVFRQGQYQVELFTADPTKGSIPEDVFFHRHPHVDSFELHVTGDLEFRLNGAAVQRTDRFEPPTGVPLGTKPLVRVRPEDWHGAISHDKNGFAFFSIQKWADGIEPTSVGLDWDGLPPSAEHAELLESER